MICAAVDIVDNHAHTVWSRENTLDLQQVADNDWGTALRQWLRDQALSPQVTLAEALVRGFDESAEITRITVNQYGTSKAQAATPHDWDQVATPTTGPAPAREPQRRATAPEPDSLIDTAKSDSTPASLPAAAPDQHIKRVDPMANHSDSPADPHKVGAEDAVEPGPQSVQAPPRRGDESFLTVNRVEEPASQGWRGLLNHIGFHLAPSSNERSERADVQAVSQHWPGPRVIVVANQKGGATKTPTTILLAACFARFGGAGVVAWDTNQLQGTLGWRTEQGPHEATAQDLLPQAERLLGTEAQSADLAHYVHHQTADRFDVLRSQPLMLDAKKRYTPTQVNAVRQVLAKYYRLIIADTSNDPSDPAWLEIMSHADQLVVATTTRDDHAEAGRLLLHDLESRGGHDAELAARAVTVVSQADQRASKSDVDRIMAGYADLTRATVRIPYDPAMVSGWLRWGALASPTRRAWLAAGAAVAAGL